MCVVSVMNFGSHLKMNVMYKKEILQMFENFFKESNQTPEDIKINLKDLRNMNVDKLTKIYNSFF